MKFSFFLFFLLLFNKSIYSQTIKGIVSTINHDPIPFASVSIKKINTPNSIFQFTTTTKDGGYTVALKSSFDTIIIEVQSPFYEPQQRTISKNDYINNQIVLDFVLYDRVTSLKEVVVESKEKPIKIKNDTTFYNPNSFKDGSEKVVEDLLKKLPGIKVEENGQVKYKNKPIKKLLLDGDDLFDNNYTIGSKNIDVNMVEQVQAIDNFNEKGLLKGLLDNDDVAINLKLKKRKTDFSGSTSLGYGFNDKYNLGVTALAVSNIYKSFCTLSYNNIGDNFSPFDFKSSIVSLDSFKDKDFLAQEIINQGNFYSNIDEKYHNLNDNFYSTLNGLYKFKKGTLVKVNLGLYSDKLKRLNDYESNYSFNGNNFSNVGHEKIVKSPNLYNANFQVAHSFKDSLEIEYIGKFNYKKSYLNSEIINNSLPQSNKVITDNYFTKQLFNLIKRINSNSAFTVNLLYCKNEAPQTLILNPGYDLTDYTYDSTIFNNQESRFDKNVINLKLEYLRKFGKLKWKINFKYDQTENMFSSKLNQDDFNGNSTSLTSFQNSQGYKINSTSVENILVCNLNKFSFKLVLNAQLYRLNLDDKLLNVFKTKNDFIISPITTLLYKFSQKSNLTFCYSLSQTAPNERNLFEGIVLTNYRSFINNDPDFRFLKTHEFSLNYSFNDFFNLQSLSLNLSHSIKRNDFFIKNDINQNIDLTTSFLLNTNAKDYGLNFVAEKYVHFVRTTFQLTSSYNLILNNNIVNNSDLRAVEFKNLNIELKVIPGLKTKFFYLDDKISYQDNIFSTKGIGQNTLKSLKNAFKFVYKINESFRWNSILNYISPDISINNNYWFFDTEIILKSKNKKIDYSIIGRNLSNNKTFKTISINDFSKTISSYNLITRFFIASVSFSF